MSKVKPVRLQYLRNKKTFSHRGVIFEVEKGAVKMCHWPHCGMDAKTTKRFAEWLLKRANDLTKPAKARKGE